MDETTERRVAILTNFMEFMPGYSLTGIVKDQVRMLTKYGHKVDLYVNEQYNGESFDADVNLKKVIPFTHLTDYSSKEALSAEHRMVVNKTAAILERELQGTPYVFTHDFAFIGWFLPYGLACAQASSKLPEARWFHWVHSVPMANRDFWNINLYGSHHKLIYPNNANRVLVAEQFKGAPSCVRVIPHIKDLRSWCDFDEETCEFLDDYPAVMDADVVQVYPCSVDRLEAKRLKEVILILSKMKKNHNVSVCLVVANQWATTLKQQQDIDHYKKIAERNGLVVGSEVVFSSDWKQGKYNVGLPKRILRELFMCSNLFIFPTREESFGLVLPEASLAGGVYCVLNSSLDQQMEVSNFTALSFAFGSMDKTVVHNEEGAWMRDVAAIILGRMNQNEAVLTKTYMRKKYNWDAIYKNYYAPTMAESEVW